MINDQNQNVSTGIPIKLKDVCTQIVKYCTIGEHCSVLVNFIFCYNYRVTLLRSVGSMYHKIPVVCFFIWVSKSSHYHLWYPYLPQ